MNRARSYLEYLTIFEIVKSELSIGCSGTDPNSTRWDTVLGYIEKKVNLIGSEVGLIVWVILPPRHITMEALGWWNEPT